MSKCHFINLKSIIETAQINSANLNVCVASAKQKLKKHSSLKVPIPGQKIISFLSLHQNLREKNEDQ